MPFRLPDLTFAPDALAPHMSAETLEFHHGKHHKAYVDKTNGMLGEKGLEGASLTEVIRSLPPSSTSQAQPLEKWPTASAFSASSMSSVVPNAS